MDATLVFPQKSDKLRSNVQGFFDGENYEMKGDLPSLEITSLRKMMSDYGYDDKLVRHGLFDEGNSTVYFFQENLYHSEAGYLVLSNVDWDFKTSIGVHECTHSEFECRFNLNMENPSENEMQKIMEKFMEAENIEDSREFLANRKDDVREVTGDEIAYDFEKMVGLRSIGEHVARRNERAYRNQRPVYPVEITEQEKRSYIIDFIDLEGINTEIFEDLEEKGFDYLMEQSEEDLVRNYYTPLDSQ